MNRIHLMLAFVACVCVGCEKPAGPIMTPAEVRAVFVSGELPRTDPGTHVWDSAPEHVAKLLLQDQMEPKLHKAAVELVRVRALHDGRSIVFRLQWADATRDSLAAPARFGDGAAIQFPVIAGGDVPDGAMGQKGRPVRIHQWKASWQDRIDKKVDVVAALYPNAVADHYPPEAARDERSRADLERAFVPAIAVGNPVTAGRSDAPLQDMVAEGFGSLTVEREQVSSGRGGHDGSGWTITIARPFDTSPDNALVPGKRTYMALAVWDGSAGNSGARKMRSGWIPLSVEDKR